MNWTQVIDPFNNMALSAMVAIIPILVIFWALIIKKMKGYQASILATAIAIVIAILVYGVPVKLATAILVSAIIALPIVGLSFKEGVQQFALTLKQLAFPIITIASVLGFAYIVNDSGITITMAEALANTGVLFPFFAPVLGWLGVFITGSDTSANALFGKLQAATAVSIGVDPVVTVAANVSGGVVGKMISPQSKAVAADAGHLIGKESELFRFSVKHSFIMLAFICVLVLAQAYLFTWLIPAYQKLDPNAQLSVPEVSAGYVYLAALAVVLAIIIAAIILANKKTKAEKLIIK